MKLAPERVFSRKHPLTLFCDYNKNIYFNGRAWTSFFTPLETGFFSKKVKRLAIFLLVEVLGLSNRSTISLGKNLKRQLTKGCIDCLKTRFRFLLVRWSVGKRTTRGLGNSLSLALRASFAPLALTQSTCGKSNKGIGRWLPWVLFSFSCNVLLHA